MHDITVYTVSAIKIFKQMAISILQQKLHKIWPNIYLNFKKEKRGIICCMILFLLHICYGVFLSWID